MHHVTALGFLLVASMPVAAQELVSEKALHAPGRAPDRIVLTWAKDPTRSQAVTWRTDTSVAKAVAECEEATEPKRRIVAVAATSPFKSDLNDAHFHTAHFEDLTPDTLYAYRVGDGVQWSEWSHFKTASGQPEKFSFLYFGDAQYKLKERWSPLVRAAFEAAPHARFSIHAGDLVNVGGRDAEWGEWFQAALPLNRTMPVIPAPGNHEYINDQGNQLPRCWNKQFALPNNGPPGVAGVFYVDFQGARILCLNTNEKLAEQVTWLKDVLKNNPQRWTIVTFHHPLYSAASGRDDQSLRQTFQPTFDKYRVDLVLQGHDHCYGRSELLSSQGGRGGTVYVVSVSGPGFYEVNNDKWQVRKGQHLQLFQVISIDGGSLHFEARTAAGDLFDSFTLQKQTDGPNVLTNGPHDPRSVLPPTTPQQPERATANEPNQWLLVGIMVLLTGFLLAIRLARRRRAA